MPATVVRLGYDRRVADFTDLFSWPWGDDDNDWGRGERGQILVRLQHLGQQNHRIIGLLERVIEMEGRALAEQDVIDEVVTQIGLDVQGLVDSGARIEAELQRLEGEGVDTTGLRAAIGSLDTAVGNIASIVPAPEQPPVDEPPADNPPADGGPPVE